MDLGGTGHKSPAHRGSRRPKRPMEPGPGPGPGPGHYQAPGYSSYSYGQAGGNPVLFEDTSVQQPYIGQGYNQPGSAAGYYGGGQLGTGGFAVPGQFVADPVVTSMAMKYGESLVGQGKLLVDQKLEKLAVSKLKYYFAVDTAYVGKKLGLLLFPFTHADWSVKYNQDEPVQPRYEINAPDLYIPVMAYATYILVAGWVLGIQNRFTPEVLGLQASTALVWLVIEMLVILVTLYVMNIQTELKTWDLLAFCSYKYVGMISSLLISVPFKKSGYYTALLYGSFALAFFLIRTLKVQILPEASQDQYTTGNKRRLYLLLFIAGVQPVMMWWLTSHLVNYTSLPSQIYPPRL